MEKESDHKLDFLDVHIDNSFTSPNVCVHRKKTFTDLLLNFFSFTSFSYKMGLVKTLVDRTYKINNIWKGFHEDINTLIDILKRNCFPSHMIEGAVNNYLTNKQNQVGSSNEPTDTPTFYFKLPYIGRFSSITQKRITGLVKRYCKNINIKLAFTSFKIGSLLSVKDPIPSGFRSGVVYKFSCAGCNACYVGETTRHFSTRIREHLITDKNSHIGTHLRNSESCRALSSRDCFHVIDQASTTYQLKIKEALHIRWENPSLNHQIKHVNLNLLL